MQNINENTTALIENFKGNKHEFEMLKGVLCASHRLDSEGVKIFYKLFNTVMIAERLDAINKEARLLYSK